MALSHELLIYLDTMKLLGLTSEKTIVIRACTIIGRRKIGEYQSRIDVSNIYSKKQLQKQV